MQFYEPPAVVLPALVAGIHASELPLPNQKWLKRWSFFIDEADA